MSATMIKGSIPMEIKKVSISAKCMVRGNELVIRPAKTNTGGEFAEQILADLIEQGYSGKELLQYFKQAQSQVRPAVEKMIGEAESVAVSESEYMTYEDIFGEEEKI